MRGPDVCAFMMLELFAAGTGANSAPRALYSFFFTRSTCFLPVGCVAERLPRCFYKKNNNNKEKEGRKEKNGVESTTFVCQNYI